MPVVPGMTSPCSHTLLILLLLLLAVTLGTELRSLSCLSGSCTPTRWNKSASRAPLSDVPPLLIFKPSFKELSPPGGALVGLGMMGGLVAGDPHPSVPPCSWWLPAVPVSLVHGTSTITDSSWSATKAFVQSPSKGDGSRGGRFKGGEESSRENSWLGKRLAGLSTSEPTLPWCPEHFPAAPAAQPDKVCPRDRHQGDNLTPSPHDKQHGPNPKTCMCPSVVPGENFQCSCQGTGDGPAPVGQPYTAPLPMTPSGLPPAPLSFPTRWLVAFCRSGCRRQERGAGGPVRPAARATWAEQDRGALADLGVGSGLARGRVLLFWNGVHWQSGVWEACIIVPAHTTPAPSQHDQPLAFMSNNIHPKFSKRQKKKSFKVIHRAQLLSLPSD